MVCTVLPHQARIRIDPDIAAYIVVVIVVVVISSIIVVISSIVVCGMIVVFLLVIIIFIVAAGWGNQYADRNKQKAYKPPFPMHHEIQFFQSALL